MAIKTPRCLKRRQMTIEVRPRAAAGRQQKGESWMKKAWLLAAVAAFALVGSAEAKTLKWGAAREIASLDPYSFGETFTLSVLNHVYEGLVRYTGDLKIEPALATAWSNP